MRVLVQWAQRNPRNWVEVADSAAWAALPKRRIPTAVGGTDDLPGWVFDVAVQGVRMGAADHIAVEDVLVGAEVGLRVTRWNDDPEDWPTGTRYAQVWTFRAPGHDPLLHGRLIDKVKELRERGIPGPYHLPGRTVQHEDEITPDDAVNTRQSVVVYAEDPSPFSGFPDVRPWGEFIPPADAVTRHGVWVTDEKAEEHFRAQGPANWRDDAPRGLSGEPRFLPHHTITYYGRDSTSAVGWVTADNETALSTATDVAGSLSASIAKSATEPAFAFTAATGQPNDADWPSGDYHLQVDFSALNGGMSIGSDNEFHRVSSDGNTDLEGTSGTWDSTTGTGVKLCTLSAFDFAAGSAGDRFAVIVYVTNGDTMKAQTATIQNVNTVTTYADGPWTAAAAADLVLRTLMGVGI